MAMTKAEKKAEKRLLKLVAKAEMKRRIEAENLQEFVGVARAAKWDYDLNEQFYERMRE